MKKRINWKVLILSIIIVYVVAFIESIFTSSSVNSNWYQQIKPGITPPNWIFPIVWNILFLLIAISLYIAWINSKKNGKRKIVLIFSLNFILNILWTFFYFQIKSPLFAFYDIIFLWLSIILMISVTYKIKKSASYLLIPYFLWVSFAAILNYFSILV